MQRFTYMYMVFINLTHYFGNKPGQLRAWLISLVHYSVVPMNVVFGLGTTLCVHMCTKLENGVLHNGQQPQSVVIGFY